MAAPQPLLHIDHIELEPGEASRVEPNCILATITGRWPASKTLDISRTISEYLDPDPVNGAVGFTDSTFTVTFRHPQALMDAMTALVEKLHFNIDVGLLDCTSQKAKEIVETQQKLRETRARKTITMPSSTASQR